MWHLCDHGLKLEKIKVLLKKRVVYFSCRYNAIVKQKMAMGEAWVFGRDASLPVLVRIWGFDYVSKHVLLSCRTRSQEPLRRWWRWRTRRCPEIPSIWTVLMHCSSHCSLEDYCRMLQVLLCSWCHRVRQLLEEEVSASSPDSFSFFGSLKRKCKCVNVGVVWLSVVVIQRSVNPLLYLSVCWNAQRISNVK